MSSAKPARARPTARPTGGGPRGAPPTPSRGTATGATKPSAIATATSTGGKDAGPRAGKPRARVARRPRRASPEPVLIGGESALEVLGQRVNALRVARDLSQEELAARADLDRTYVSGIERGGRNPTLLVLLRLARALGVTLDGLVAAAE